MLGKVIQKILALHAELPLFKEKKSSLFVFQMIKNVWNKTTS